MVTRRLFLKSTGIACLTLGFAPSFVARAAEAAGTRMPRSLLFASSTAKFIRLTSAPDDTHVSAVSS